MKLLLYILLYVYYTWIYKIKIKEYTSVSNSWDPEFILIFQISVFPVNVLSWTQKAF